MSPLCGCWAILGCLLSTAGMPDPMQSYLWAEEWRPDGICRVHAEPYVPQPGDLIFFSCPIPVIDDVLYWLAGSAPEPEYCAIVIALHEGTPALLDCAPDTAVVPVPFVCISEVYKRLQEYDGTIHVRRLKCPLTPDQSAALTAFALDQKGKPMALLRCAALVTPFSPRGHLRSKLFGKTDLHRHAWSCSELTVAAGTAAGLFDPQQHKANTILPHDLFDDKAYDLSGTWYPAAQWSACPGGEVHPPHHVTPCGM
jgi:hypothetical protein